MEVTYKNKNYTLGKKVHAYIMTSSKQEQIEDIAENFALDKGFISNDFKDFSLKFGVNIDDSMVANSIFIIDKEGVIKYKEIPTDLEDDFKIEDFSITLNEVVNFKPKGHTHENWMGV